MRKRILALVSVLLLIVLISGCKKDVDIDLTALRQELLAAGIFDDELVSLSQDIIPIEAEVDSALFISAEYWKGSGVTGEEIGLFRCGSNKDAKALEKQLTEHRDSLYDIYASYKQEALPRIGNAVIRCSGSYVVFVSAQDYKQAARIVDQYF